MTIHVVTKEGVYIQDVYGPYNDKYMAKQAAIRLAKADEDAYHYWIVNRLTDEGLQHETFRINKETADMIV